MLPKKNRISITLSDADLARLEKIKKSTWIGSPENTISTSEAIRLCISTQYLQIQQNNR